jgi:hypothetical protein
MILFVNHSHSFSAIHFKKEKGEKGGGQANFSPSPMSGTGARWFLCAEK